MFLKPIQTLYGGIGIDMNITIIHNDCDPNLAENKELPSNSYLVTYLSEGEIKHDIVQSNAQVQIFDQYYDKYKEIKGIKWTEGIVSPKVWNYQPPISNKKKR